MLGRAAGPFSERPRRRLLEADRQRWPILPRRCADRRRAMMIRRRPGARHEPRCWKSPSRGRTIRTQIAPRHMVHTAPLSQRHREAPQPPVHAMPAKLRRAERHLRWRRCNAAAVAWSMASGAKQQHAIAVLGAASKRCESGLPIAQEMPWSLLQTPTTDKELKQRAITRYQRSGRGAALPAIHLPR